LDEFANLSANNRYLSFKAAIFSSYLFDGLLSCSLILDCCLLLFELLAELLLLFSYYYYLAAGVSYPNKLSS
jgi:hypothetical protein